MDEPTQTQLAGLWSADRDLQNRAFLYILEATETPVDWAYEAWDEVVANLSHEDNHNRAIAAQILCNLAKSDPQDRMRNETIRAKALALIETEADPRYRKKYAGLWKIRQSPA